MQIRIRGTVKIYNIYSPILHQNTNSCHWNLHLLLNTAMANTDFLNLCGLFQIINDVGYKGSFLESPVPPLALPAPGNGSDGNTEGKQRGTTNQKISDRFKHFRAGNLLSISTKLSRDCEILQRLRAQNPHSLEKCGFPRTADQEMQENIIATCKIFSMSCQLTSKILHLMVNS